MALFSFQETINAYEIQGALVSDFDNIGQFPAMSGEGSNTANEALLRATLAFDRIDRHEIECSKRWGLVIKLMLLVLAQLGGLLLFLLSDKLGWFL